MDEAKKFAFEVPSLSRYAVFGVFVEGVSGEALGPSGQKCVLAGDESTTKIAEEDL